MATTFADGYGAVSLSLCIRTEDGVPRSPSKCPVALAIGDALIRDGRRVLDVSVVYDIIWVEGFEGVEPSEEIREVMLAVDGGRAAIQTLYASLDLWPACDVGTDRIQPDPDHRERIPRADRAARRRAADRREASQAARRDARRCGQGVV